jgi:hypothetical protein
MYETKLYFFNISYLNLLDLGYFKSVAKTEHTVGTLKSNSNTVLFIPSKIQADKLFEYC